jgi:NAD(P)-dependent dehydrogenase (short-subunit alcohol dehydrogenase family)
MLLENKNAVIYGGGGSVGGAVARAFAREGAQVFLAGRTPAKLEAVAEQIRAAGDWPRRLRSTRSTSARSTSTPTPWRRMSVTSTSRST